LARTFGSRIPEREAAVRYDDDDDFDRRGPAAHPSASGMIGFIFSLVTVALLAVVVLLYVLLKQDELQGENAQRFRYLMWFFLIIDFISFLTGLSAVIMCGRGLSPSNTLYRGWSVLGLILGIIELLITVGFGFFMTCVVLVTEVTRARPGG
jgi:hypothetical protein